MNIKDFITTLFMFIAGLFFIAVAFTPIVLNIVDWIDNNNIKNNGEQITATITFRDIISYSPRQNNNFSNLTRTYFIEYYVNGEKYFKSIESTERNHNEGETITIYCLLDNPEKIYVPLEDNVRILSILIVFPIFSMLGYTCVKYFHF